MYKLAMRSTRVQYIFAGHPMANGTVQSSISFVFAIQCDFSVGGVDGMTFFVSPTMNFSTAVEVIL
jgi:hypothetical protein